MYAINSNPVPFIQYHAHKQITRYVKVKQFQFNNRSQTTCDYIHFAKLFPTEYIKINYKTQM